jgi:hypothetical protein
MCGFEYGVVKSPAISAFVGGQESSIVLLAIRYYATVILTIGYYATSY